MAEQTALSRDTDIDVGLLDWLFASDPAVRWQVLRDLTDATPHRVAVERARVATEGWGARLLAAQDPDGRWAGAIYSPKWTSTTYTLLFLHWLGLEPGNPQALRGCAVLWEAARFYGGGLTLAKTVHEPETCITGMLVLLAASFGHQDDRVDPTVRWLLGQQLADGGWNCRTVRDGSRHGSFHTTGTVLDALLTYQRAGGAVLTRFPFPPQWHFDVLRGLEHFRASGAERDERLADAVGVVAQARRRDGTWPAHRPYPGREWFRMEATGRPSRWATLRTLRVLRWWEQG